MRSTILSYRVIHGLLITVCLQAMVGVSFAADAPKVDFSYAFGTPHRITTGRPAASDRTLVDLQPGNLRMAWTYEDLTMEHFPILSFKTPRTDWNVTLTPQIDGKSPAKSRWTRLDAVLPAVDNCYEDPRGSIRLEVLGGMTAALVRVTIHNTDSKPHQFLLRCDSGSWGENPAWLDANEYVGDNIVAGWNERADRVLVLGVGADAYSTQADKQAPGPRNLVMVWNLKPGEKRQGWLVRPYHGYAADLPKLRKSDWGQEFEQGKKEWNDLLGRISKLSIPDAGVTNAYLACFADCYIMREPAGKGYIVNVPGTEGYRAANSGEGTIVAIAIDQNGLHDDALKGYKASLEMQSPEGDWNDYKGWGHSWWGASGFKSWFVREHYRIAQDKQFLADVYPRMLASSRFNERQRAKSRKAGPDRPLNYGLMPRGFGDCGLMNDGDLYGTFLPHNIWAVYADRCTLEVAKILGKNEDVAELQKIYETAQKDLMTAIDRGAIKEKDYRWIPGVPGKTSGSCWGALNVTFPCELLPADHELVTGTLKKIEANVSKGGQPIHTGWMADGAWVAITLDNIAETHLLLGNGDVVAKYFYSTLNHGTPLYTWCEERGQEPGTPKTSGDRQHLWTPVAVVRCLRDMLVMEQKDCLHLALATDRSWLASGKPVGIANACTYLGNVSYQMQLDPTKSEVIGEATFAPNSTAASAILHVRLPDGRKVKAVNPESGAEVTPDGSGIRWKNPRGTLKFRATIGS
jgi:hypothetical protein